MQAIQFESHGGPEVLQVKEVDSPKPGLGQVAVKLHAAGINHLDIWVRMGMPGIQFNLPHIPGSDGCGEISEIGGGVEGWSIGDRVVVSPGFCNTDSEYFNTNWDSLSDSYHLLGLQVPGTYCEEIVVHKDRVIKVSGKLSYEEWASVSLVFLTAQHMLYSHAGLQESDTVLVHAAGSGIGSAAIQIAKLAGARVITTVGSDEKIQKAKALGADHVIQYKKSDFAEEVKTITNGRGVSVIFEHIGPETWNKNLSCLSKGGRMVTCGATSGPKADMDLRFLFMRQYKISGSYMGGLLELKEVVNLIDQGKLKPVLDKVFDLKDASKAHRYIEERKNFGKVVLKI